MSWSKVPRPSGPKRQTCQNIWRAARQTMHPRKLQYWWSSSRWEMTVVFHRSAPLKGKAGLELGSRDLGSPCGLTCSVAWQRHGGGGTALVRSPTGALRSSGVVLSSGRPLANTDKGNAFVLLFLGQRRGICSKACLPGKYPPFLFLAFSSGQFVSAVEFLGMLFEEKQKTQTTQISHF